MATKRFVIGGTLMVGPVAEHHYHGLARWLGAEAIISLPGWGIGPIGNMVEPVVKQIRTRLRPGDTVELHGHSLGGIAGVLCAARMTEVTEVVTYGAPHRGIPASRLLDLIPGVDFVAPGWCELRPRSAFMSAYKAIRDQVDGRLVSVAIHDDPVVPLESSLAGGLNILVTSDAEATRLVLQGYTVQVAPRDQHAALTGHFGVFDYPSVRAALKDRFQMLALAS